MQPTSNTAAADRRPGPPRAPRMRIAERLRAVFDRLAVRQAALMLTGATTIGLGANAVYLHEIQEYLLEQVGGQVNTAVVRAADDIDNRVLVRKRTLEAVAADLASLHGDGIDVATAEAFLAEHSALLALFDRVVLIRADGRALAARPRATGWRELDVSDRDYFRRARETGRLVVSEPVMGKLAQAPIVTMAVPLPAPGGGFGGVLIGAMNLVDGGIFDQVRGAPIGAAGHFFALTRSGSILMHPVRERLLAPAGPATEDPASARALAGYTGWLVVDAPAERAGVYAFKALNHAPWIVGAHLPAGEALAPVRRAQASAMFAGLGSLLALGLLVWLVAEASVRPLARLAQEVGELEGGVRTGAVNVRGAYEVRQVAEAFNRVQQAQSRLRETMAAREAFHRSLNESSPLAIFVADEGGEWTYVNRRLEQLFGRRLELLAGDGWLQAVHPDDRRRVAQEWAAALRGNRPLEGRWRLAVDGSTVWVQVQAVPLPEHAAAGGFVGALADVTAERHALEQADRERARSEGIVEAMTDGIVVVDEAGRIAHFNAAAERLTGWRREAAVGIDLDHVVRLFADEGGTRVDLASYRRESRTASDEWWCEGAGGARTPVDVHWVRTGPQAAVGALQGGVLVLSDASQRRERAQRLAWQARHDSLTGLLNRRAFEETLVARYEAFVYHGVNSALVLIDLDHFKRVNDGGGHDAGDEMLKRVADVLRANVRESDYAARLGGDEFALVLPGCPEVRAQSIAHGIRAEIAALRVERDGQSFAIGASFGIASFAIGDEDSQVLVRRADAACYRAKANGRNAVEIESVAARAEFELF
jgi:diguanylate cyclase (GGDEF)-like protein/PAS domain S-box-containing protein